MRQKDSLENDEKNTLQYLLTSSSSHSGAELRAHLTFLKSRFNQNEHSFGTTFWSSIISQTKFEKDIFKEEGSNTPNSSEAVKKQDAITVFQNFSNEGKFHIKALTTLLQISPEDAAHLTYRALESTSSEKKNESINDVLSKNRTLVGSLNLIAFAHDYYIQEHVVRLRALTECLRIDLDEDQKEECATEIRTFLDELDSQYQIQFASNDDEENQHTHSRGIFRMLLISACCGGHSILRNNINSLPLNNDLCELYEEAALEALLVLLYGKRMNGDKLRRWDLMILLLAMESKNFFCSTKSVRIPKLAALVCAEAMSLWRLMTLPPPASHALLHRYFTNHADAQKEIQSILHLLQKNSYSANKRRAKKMTIDDNYMGKDSTEAPEAVALLAFGLLLLLVQSRLSNLDETANRFLRTNGMESIRQANDDFGAFAYLQCILKTLLPQKNTQYIKTNKHGIVESISAEIQYEDTKIKKYDDAAIVMYSSIGREIINATIYTFYQGSGSKISNFPVTDIQNLSTLLAVSYRDQSTSRISFWNTWYNYNRNKFKYVESDENDCIDPVCFLVDAAHQLAVSAIKVDQHDITLLPSVAPLLEIVSALVCDLQTMTFAMEGTTRNNQIGGVVLLPPSIISRTLMLCAKVCHRPNDNLKMKAAEHLCMMSAVKTVLDSISILIQTGKHYLFSLLFGELEKNNFDPIQLPRQIYLIAVNAPHADIAYTSLDILANLLSFIRDHSQKTNSFHTTVSRCLEGYGGTPAGFSLFSLTTTNLHRNQDFFFKVSSPNLGVLALMKITSSLSSNVCEIINVSHSENIINPYLKTILNGVGMACDTLVLTSSLHTPLIERKSTEEFTLNFECVRAIICALRSIQSFVSHSDPVVSAACQITRHSIVYRLATTPQLGRIIAHHATLPIASALRGTLMVKAWEIQNQARSGNKKDDKYFGEWNAIAASRDKEDNKMNDYSSFEKKITENIDLVEFDMGVLQNFSPTNKNCGENCNQNVNFGEQLLKIMANEATTLLLLWTKFAEEIIDESRILDESSSMNQEDLRILSPVWKVLICQSSPPSLRFVPFEGGKMRAILQRYNDEIREMLSKGSTRCQKIVGTTAGILSMDEHSQTFWPINLSWLSLLSRYITDVNDRDGDTGLLSNNTLELLILINKQLSDLEIPTSKLFCISLNGGFQLHKSFLKCLQKNVDGGNENKKTSHFLFQVFRLLSFSIESNPEFAAVLLLGKVTNGNIDHDQNGHKNKLSEQQFLLCDLVWNLILRVAGKLSSESSDIDEEQLALAAQSARVISILYEVCQRDIDDKHGFSTFHSCFPALKYFIVQNSFFSDLFKILKMKPILLNTRKKNDVQTVLQSMVKNPEVDNRLNKRINAIHLLSCTFRILAMELHSSSQLTSDTVHDGIKSYFQFDKGDGFIVSHDLFSMIKYQFDGIKLSAKETQVLKKTSREIGSSSDIILSLINRRNYKIYAWRTYDSLWTEGITSSKHQAYDTLTSSMAEYILQKELAEKQAHFIKSWRLFIDTSTDLLFDRFIHPSTLSKKSENIERSLTSPNVKSKLFLNDETDENASLVWSASLIHYTVSALEELSESIIQAAIFDTPGIHTREDASSSSTIYDAADVATELLKTLLSALDKYHRLFQISSKHYERGLQANFQGLMNIAGKLFAVKKSSQNKIFLMLGCKLRLHVLSAALIFLQVIGGFDSNEVSPNEFNTELEARLTLSDLVCDTVCHLRYEPTHNSHPYEYNFSVLIGKNFEQSNSFSLFCTCLAVLNSLLIFQTLPSTLRLATESYFTNLAASFRRWKIIPSLLQHMFSASEVAVNTYNILNSRTSHTQSINGDDIASSKHDASLMIVRRILDFANLVCASTSTSEIALLLMKDRIFIHSIIKNPLFKQAGLRWSNLSNAGNHDHRGYIVIAGAQKRSNKLRKQTNGTMMSTRQALHDSVHTIWIMVLNTVTSLLNLHANDNGKFLDSSIDFFCSYDSVILSSLSGGLADLDRSVFDHSENDSYVNTNRNSRSLFTPNNLLESSASLSFLSELYKCPRFQRFKNLSSPFPQKQVFETVCYAVRSLSTFLGASGRSRELFEAVSTLNRDIEDQNSLSSPNRTLMEQQIKHVLHMNPIMLAEGVPNARHDAISNAHYAISCCVNVTPDDFQKSEKIVNNIKHEVNFHEFYNHVNNEFSLKMEQLAAKALYFALSVIERVNPSSSSFVSFDSRESERIDPTIFVQVGTIIVVRPKPVSNFLPTLTENNKDLIQLRFAKVLRCRNYEKTWDIQYLSSFPNSKIKSTHSHEYENNVSFSRLAGIREVSKKQTALKYNAAPKLPALAYLSEIGIGHLILTLRWCKERAEAKRTNMNNDDSAILHCLSARAALLLATEVKLHNEISNDVEDGFDEAKVLNLQLFELFGGIIPIKGMDSQIPKSCLVRAHEKHATKRNGLESVIKKQILEAILFHLETNLKNARDDHVAQLKDRLGRNVQSPGRGSGRRRRSPF